MTKNQKDLRTRIKKAEIILEKLYSKHSIQGCVTQKTKYGGANCAVCGKDLGWWCPKSPNNQCEYTDEDYGCNICGEPEERK